MMLGLRTVNALTRWRDVTLFLLGGREREDAMPELLQPGGLVFGRSFFRF